MSAIRKSALAGLGLATVIAISVIVWAVGHDFAQPRLPGRSESDFTTNAMAGIVRLLVWVFGMLTLGLLAMAAFGRSESHHHQHDQDPRARRLTAAARPLSLMWFLVSAIGIVVVTAADSRLPYGYVLSDIGTHLRATQTAQLWLLQTILVFVASIILGFSRSIGGIVAAGYLGILALLPHTVVGIVSVGADHDYATDAMVLLTLAASVWWPLAAATLFGPAELASPEALRRFRRVSTPAALIVLVGTWVVGWQALAGTSMTAGGFGLVRLALLVIAGVLAVLSVARMATRSDALTRASLPVDLVLGAVSIGLWVASEAIAPPRYRIPQDTQTNYLGYTIDTPPTLELLMAPGRPSLLLVVMAVVAIVGYLGAVVILFRRGDRWPWHRTVLWVVGWVVMLGVTATGLWKYAAASFSLHMLVHMTSNMIGPVLIVMGAPITLALRMLPGRDSTGARGTRDLLNAILGWKPLEYFLHPLAVWFYFVSAFYLLYFTPLFGTLMRYHWGHQLMTLHFLIIGMLFYGLCVGEDRPPKPLPHVGKLGFLFAAMPFHAFFAVTIMSTPRVLGGDFYKSIAASWVDDLMADQHMGGSITWATGEIPMLMVIVFLFFQWQRSERKETVRSDRAMDSGLDDSFDAYNEMLARIAENDQRGPR